MLVLPPVPGGLPVTCECTNGAMGLQSRLSCMAVYLQIYPRQVGRKESTTSVNCTWIFNPGPGVYDG